MAPQHPKKPTTMISAPAPITIYTPTDTYTHAVQHMSLEVYTAHTIQTLIK